MSIQFINNPLVSIVLCSFNGEKYINDQIDSLIKQTYRNIEIIVVDDDSVDNTVNIVKRNSFIDNRIKFFVNEINLGYNLNFLKAIGLSKGDFIAICDQDDIWIESKIEQMLLEWDKSSILIHHASKEFIDGNSLPDINDIKSRQGFSGANVKELLLGNTVQGCTIFFHKDLKDKLPIFNKDVIYDWTIAVCATVNGGIQYIHKNLIYHRRHNDSAHYSIQGNLDKVELIDEKIRHYSFFKQNINFYGHELQFVNGLIAGYLELKTCLFSIQLFNLIFANSSEIFIKKKSRFPFFSKFFFSYRSARGLKWFYIFQ
ncbi:MAG: glycosyltransferase [Marinilabiliaceae bacterium]|nr:glycosyltransferase [Marinilabiliaceae bacterium]